MIVHHLDCGNMRPRGARFAIPQMADVPCNCLLVETGEGLVLVDTGLGIEDMRDPSRLGRSNVLLHCVPDPEMPAARQVEKLGFRRDEVKDVVCTHLDRDHAGGLPDFPKARVHVSDAERRAALHPEGRGEHDRYRPCHFAHGPLWEGYGEADYGPWFGFGAVPLRGVPPGLLLIPLPGHTRGHCAVAVETGDGWLLHCGDAYYIRRELDPSRPAPAGVRVFRRVAHEDFPLAMQQLQRIGRLRDEHESDVKLLSAHDKGGPDAL